MPAIASTDLRPPEADPEPPAPPERPPPASAGSAACAADDDPLPADAPGSARPELPRRDRWLRAACERFRDHPRKRPITPQPLDSLLDPLHRDGVARRLARETYGWRAGGMSAAHAPVRIRTLRGELVADRRAA